MLDGQAHDQAIARNRVRDVVDQAFSPVGAADLAKTAKRQRSGSGKRERRTVSPVVQEESRRACSPCDADVAVVGDTSRTTEALDGQGTAIGYFDLAAEIVESSCAGRGKLDDCSAAAAHIENAAIADRKDVACRGSWAAKSYVVARAVGARVGALPGPLPEIVRLSTATPVASSVTTAPRPDMAAS